MTGDWTMSIVAGGQQPRPRHRLLRSPDPVAPMRRSKAGPVGSQEPNQTGGCRSMNVVPPVRACTQFSRRDAFGRPFAEDGSRNRPGCAWLKVHAGGHSCVRGFFSFADGAPSA